MRTVDVYLPDEPYIDHESIAASEAFREFVRSREYAKWAKKERQKWGSADHHTRTWSLIADGRKRRRQCPWCPKGLMSGCEWHARMWAKNHHNMLHLRPPEQSSHTG